MWTNIQNFKIKIVCEPVKVCFKLSSKGKLGMASEHRMQLLDGLGLA